MTQIRVRPIQHREIRKGVDGYTEVGLGSSSFVPYILDGTATETVDLDGIQEILGTEAGC